MAAPGLKVAKLAIVCAVALKATVGGSLAVNVGGSLMAGPSG